MIILGIESSCDETACAIVKDGREVLFIESEIQPYVIVRNYNPNAPEGQQWDSGLYLNTLNQLAKTITAVENIIGYDRMSEIASKAIDNLDDWNFDDFNSNVDLWDDERDYFGLANEEEEI